MSNRDLAPKSGPELKDWLLARFPSFIEMFSDPWYFPPDKVYTPHGVCMEFTDYYRKHISNYDAPEVIELFAMAETVIAADRLKVDDMANALCTCFLENISCTDEGHAGRRHMGPESISFFDGWHYPYLRERGLPEHN